MNIYMLGFSIALTVSTVFIYGRKKAWLNSTIKWGLASVVFIVGLIGLLYFNKLDKMKLIFSYHLTIPFLTLIIDEIFKRFSYYIHGRDFYLYLTHSDEIDNSIFGKNPHIKFSDIAFSFALFLFAWFSTIFGYEFFFGSI
ncbi:hypothetical protein [Winogradskyella haliclonae]|uniref:Lycopene cyclase domain-containing protein n=1 Tax=Winogradskyella haliclonae TaxID=2048558 RepID=A0ABQ2C2D8_9FLAO|nr:hypothetical protein [Winogradskyella haliclonae]GGI58228.1 hypothetical protein GCM10011444_25370 [Winogradskyella haliclonae]